MISPKSKSALARLGRDIRAARLRRNMARADLARTDIRLVNALRHRDRARKLTAVERGSRTTEAQTPVI